MIYSGYDAGTKARLKADDMGTARTYAIAALEALREPTRAMLDTGAFHCIDGAGAVSESDAKQAQYVFHAMTDKALGK